MKFKRVVRTFRTAISAFQEKKIERKRWKKLKNCSQLRVTAMILYLDNNINYVPLLGWARRPTTGFFFGVVGVPTATQTAGTNSKNDNTNRWRMVRAFRCHCARTRFRRPSSGPSPRCRVRSLLPAPISDVCRWGTSGLRIININVYIVYTCIPIILITTIVVVIYYIIIMCTYTTRVRVF